jgi:multimeric flavodoxin WrbA
MKVLFVNSNPHEKGCTHRTLTEMAETLENVDITSDL